MLAIDVRKAKDGQLTGDSAIELLDKLIKQDELKWDAEAEALKHIDGEISKIDAELGKAEQNNKTRNELIKSINEKSSQLKNLQEKKEKSAEFVRIKKEQQNAWQAQLSALKDAEINKLKIETEYGKINDRKSQIDTIKTLISEHSAINNSYKTAQEKYINLRNLTNSLTNTYIEINRAFLDAQAGILAGTLIDGEPCPVCGSTEHPSPAEISDKAPTEKDVKSAKERADKAQADAIGASNLAATEKGKLESKDKEISVAALSIFGVQFPSLQAQLSNPITSSHENLNETITSELSEITEHLATLSADIRKEEERYRQKATIEANLPTLEKELINADNIASNNERAVATLTAEIGELKSTVEKLVLTFVDTEKLINQKKEFTADKSMLTSKFTAISSRLNTNNNIKKHIDKHLHEVAETEERWKWVKSLSDTANGQLAGKDKIMLETYVQTAYFDRIIRRANIRFMVMSRGQYELKRAVDTGNLRSQSGLELNIIDHSNASEDSVRTLSGGESFMAALSLALGLSDEIQSTSGGIRLDTMFVDEGFGSLDEDTLSQALTVLNNLAKSNLLVGIISHVAILKERIDRQIVVEKGRSGSRVRIPT